MARFRTFAELAPGNFFCRQRDCAGGGQDLPVFVKLPNEKPSAGFGQAMQFQPEKLAKAISLPNNEEVRWLAFP